MRCICGKSFNMQHAMSCKKVGFITLRHNEIRDMRVERSLLNSNGEEEAIRTTIKNNNKVSQDVRVGEFWG